LCYGPKAGQFGQVLVSAKLHLCWCYTFADLGAFYASFVVGARLASPHGTLKDGFQSSYAISTFIRFSRKTYRNFNGECHEKEKIVT
jgi:hypothetical protein